MLFICSKRLIENEVIYSIVALHLTNCLGLIKIHVHYILIIIECHVYIVVLNVLYDDVYMYKSLQIKFLFCSVIIMLKNQVSKDKYNQSIYHWNRYTW